MSLSRPKAITVDVDHIPKEIKDLSRWVCWSYERRKDNWKKPPIECRTGRWAKVTETSSLVGFDEAVAYYRDRKLDGIGFVFLKADPYSGIDLDDCRKPATGELEPWATEICETLDSYGEVSPSGQGVKLIVRGKLSCAGKRKNQIELYSEGRYFTITGNRLPNLPTTIQQRQQQLLNLYERVFGNDEGQCDFQALKASNRLVGDGENQKYNRLWAGDISDYPSQSEADLALCILLANRFGLNKELIESEFNKSSLAKREKWSARSDYRNNTISKAIKIASRSMSTRGSKSNQEETRSNQELTGNNNTGGGGVGVLYSDYEEESIQIALALAQTESKAPDWQSSFQLARKLHSLSAQNPEQFEKAVVAFCQQAGKPFEEFWYAFLDCWQKVRFAEGDDIFSWASKQAQIDPYPLTYSLGVSYAKLAAVAYHLSRHTKEKPFWLPRERLAETLNVSAKTVSRIINLLEKKSIIRCVNSDYSYTARRAKEYLFTAEIPVGGVIYITGEGNPTCS